MRARPALTSRLYSRDFATASACQFCFMIAAMLMSHYARWIVFLGGSVQDVGWIIGGGALAAFLLRPVAGSCIDRMGALNAWLVGLLMSLMALLVNLQIHEIDAVIYTARAFLFVGTGLVFSSGMTFITQISPQHRRTEAIGMFGASGFIAMVAGPMLGDAILGEGQRSRTDFDTLFYVSAVAVFLSVTLLLHLRNRKPEPGATESPLHFSSTMKSVWRYWPGAITLVNFAFGICLTVPFVFLASYVDDIRLETPFLSPVGLFFLAYGGWGFFVRLWLRRVPDRLGRRKVLLAGMTLNSVGMFCFLAIGPDSSWMILLPGVLCGTGHALCNPTLNALILDHFPDHFRGMGCTVSLMIVDSGMIFGAPLLGMIAERAGYAGMYSTAGCVALAAMLYLLWNTVPIWRARREESMRAASAFATISEPYKVLRPGSGEPPASIAGDAQLLDDSAQRFTVPVDE